MISKAKIVYFVRKFVEKEDEDGNGERKARKIKR